MKPKTTNSLVDEITSIMKTLKENTYKGGNRFLLDGHLEIGGLLSREFSSDVLDDKSRQKMKSLTEKISSQMSEGFSRRTLYYALKFYQSYRNKKLDYRLGWGHYRILASVSNLTQRKKLEKEAAENNWSREILERKARESGYYGGMRRILWKRPDGDIFHYKIVNKDVQSEKTLWIDFGFHFYKKVDGKGFSENDIVALNVEKKNWKYEKQNPDSKSLLYHYLGNLERVIDGDTLLVQMELGFGAVLRERIRLLGVNAPELGSPEGEEIFASLKKKLKPGSSLLIRTHFVDKYGRYLGDVLYLREKNADFKKLKTEGIHLNEELANLGY
ncbi:DUF1016 N-terminal domain-containing protein [Leptospira weilii]|uniref:DUF1016 N-terminal domain-containing protein n=1 Tax=Leptospira weilii TaxID=28184 RepID=UPI0007748ECA|nr:DUF1016 N-terminal domain-containing protein [Leptospira weilii]